MKLSITSYSAITANGLFKSGKQLFKNRQPEDFNAFIKEAYRFINTSYPKFFKMDELCKLAFLATEVLLSENKLESTADGADIAIVLGNRSSSVASDLKHVESIRDRNNYFPSPAVFVYTLPNIMLGEICIRHQITGENSCFLMKEPDADFLYAYVQDLFENENYNYCITGWVDYNALHFNACLCLVERQIAKNHLLAPFNKEFIKLISTENE